MSNFCKARVFRRKRALKRMPGGNFRRNRPSRVDRSEPFFIARHARKPVLKNGTFSCIKFRLIVKLNLLNMVFKLLSLNGLSGLRKSMGTRATLRLFRLQFICSRTASNLSPTTALKASIADRSSPPHVKILINPRSHVVPSRQARSKTRSRNRDSMHCLLDSDAR